MRRLLPALCLVLATLAAPTLGQDLIDPQDAQHRRELRSLGQRSVTDPAAAAAGVAAARRTLRNENLGVDLPPERARIDRRLEATGEAAANRARAREQPAAPPPAAPPPSADLPSSVAPGPLPSMGR
jgi:hypothetical protein